MEPLSLSTNIFAILGGQNRGQSIRRNPQNARKAAERCACIVANTPLNANCATIVVDYAYPTPVQKRFVRAYVQLVNNNGLLKKCSKGVRNIQAVARLAVMRDCCQFYYISFRLTESTILLDAMRVNNYSLTRMYLQTSQDWSKEKAAAASSNALELYLQELQGNPEMRKRAVSHVNMCCFFGLNPGII